MQLKIKLKEGKYALRTYDDEGNQIFYTSSRIGGLIIKDNELLCEVPEQSKKYEIKDLTTYQIVSSGEINVYDKSKDLPAKK